MGPLGNSDRLQDSEGTPEMPASFMKAIVSLQSSRARKKHTDAEVRQDLVAAFNAVVPDKPLEPRNEEATTTSTLTPTARRAGDAHARLLSTPSAQGRHVTDGQGVGHVKEPHTRRPRQAEAEATQGDSRYRTRL